MNPNPIMRMRDGTLVAAVSPSEYAKRWSPPISEEEAAEEIALQIREFQAADAIARAHQREVYEARRRFGGR